MCDDSILISVTQSCFFAGMLVALLVGGPLSDYFGRRFVWYTGTHFIIIATWIMVYPKVLAVFIVCRIFIGVGSGMQISKQSKRYQRAARSKIFKLLQVAL